VMPFSLLIQMGLVILERMYPRTRGMRNSSINSYYNNKCLLAHILARL
jgi:hypothetical protein